MNTLVNKMNERFKTPCAVMLMLTKKTETGEEILLQKRQNTGFADGFYDLSASGHVEDNESMETAMCREAKEELNIDINPEDLEFICLIHKNLGRGIYVNVYFKVTKWNGEPIINEPHKNAEIKWFNINELPKNLINDRIEAIHNYKENIKYCEYGWKL